jgi:esterase/lipase superfamily enzyme
MKRPRRLIGLGVLLITAVAGFGVSEALHRPPTFNLSGIEFPYALHQSHGMPVIEVLFVTNRRPLPGRNDGVFGNERDDTLHYGRAEVRIPTSHTIADVQRPDIPRGLIDEDQATLLTINLMSESSFRSHLKRRMAGHENDGATLFVHGINNSFDSAVREGGSLQFGLNLRRPIIVFSWPTLPGVSIDSYRSSQAQVDASARALEMFLEPYRRSHFNLVAHSLGSKVVCQTFRRLIRNTLWNTHQTELPNVILAAPDVGTDTFTGAFLSEAKAVADRTTIYVASNDHALVMSEILNGRSRLATSITPEYAVRTLVDMTAGDNSRVEIIDAKFVNNARTTHGYYYQSRAVFADFYNLIRNNLPAHQRNLLRVKNAQKANYWIIPP